MQFNNLKFPSQPATDKWLRETNARDDVAITVPLTMKEDGVPWIFGAMILSDEAISAFYNNLSGWSLLAEYSFKRDFDVYDDDFLEPSIGLIHEDAHAIGQLANKLGEKIVDLTGIAFAPYVNGPMGEMIDKTQKNCGCNSISEPQVQVSPGFSPIGERVYMCTKCAKAHGMEYESQPIRKEKAFDANWILESETADGFIDTDDNSVYLLHSTGEKIGKLEYSIAFMSMIGGSVNPSFSSYIPDKQNALVCVKNNTIAGYLTWTIDEDYQSLQQLFTREKYRDEGVASTLLSTWSTTFCKHEFFYVEEPNDKSRRLLKKLGYTDGKPRAVEHYLLRGIANDFEQGINKADSLSELQRSLDRQLK